MEHDRCHQEYADFFEKHIFKQYGIKYATTPKSSVVPKKLLAQKTDAARNLESNCRNMNMNQNPLRGGLAIVQRRNSIEMKGTTTFA